MKLPRPGWPRPIPTKVLLACATLGPVGRRLPAPGTWGSVAGLLYFTVFFAQGTGDFGVAVLNVVGLYLAVAICGEAEVRMRRTDPGEVILDEFVSMPLCFLGWTRMSGSFPPWMVLVAGLALFRVFDILKPFGIRRLQTLPGGWGVVVDDVAAALATCTCLHLAIWAWYHVRL